MVIANSVNTSTESFHGSKNPIHAVLLNSFIIFPVRSPCANTVGSNNSSSG